MTRNYAEEMRLVLDEYAIVTDPTITTAHRIVDHLRATDPDLLAGYLDIRAAEIIRNDLNYLDRASRAHVRQTQARGVFADAVITGSVKGWLDERIKYVINESKDRRALRDMTHDDLTFVAEDYHARFEEIFFRELARQVTTGTVGDHFTEEEI
jgi:hypothetical protein